MQRDRCCEGGSVPRQLLDATEISSSIEELHRELPQPLDAALAWTVREGVTYVIRHSWAHHCRLWFTQEQGRVGVEVFNALERAEDTPAQGIGQGSGLLGLQERVSALGATMEAGPLNMAGKPHFRLRVELPLLPQMALTVLQEERS